MPCKAPLHCDSRKYCMAEEAMVRLFRRRGIFRDNKVRLDTCKKLGLKNDFTKEQLVEFVARKCGVISPSRAHLGDEIMTPTMLELSPEEHESIRAGTSVGAPAHDVP